MKKEKMMYGKRIWMPKLKQLPQSTFWTHFQNLRKYEISRLEILEILRVDQKSTRRGFRIRLSWYEKKTETRIL